MAICPICKSEAKALDKVSEPDGFDCGQHGRFKVSGTAQITRRNESQDQWEAALKRARARQTTEWAPVIVDNDFL
jgi:hypothetical protein